MPSLKETLQADLGTSYLIERELGGGGMARVFLATESALGRRIVIKVLPPELAETVTSARFHREIQVAAGLQHPHIVPLLTAGQTGGLLYYSMPFVEGETLRHRLEREGELPVADACRILAEVSRALSYAHRRGIVHRDIKPENILLAEGEAQVADFGIAKAIAASTEGENLTTGGLVLGTPAYMAPEQAAADAAVDARSDLYALGVVAYEMLTGSPPFSERTAQAMMAAHAVRRPEPLLERRPAVQSRLASLVMRLLEKHPADRPQSADEVLRQLDAMTVPLSPTVVTEAYGAKARRGRWLVAGGTAVLALLVLAAWLRSRPATATLDPKVVAVVPFRVTGADSSLRYLREGMLDLLATKLSGTRNLRTVDPRTLLRAWRRGGGSAELDVDRGAALRLSREVGAGRLLEGEVIGTPRHMVLNATLNNVEGQQVVRASVEGPADSLTALVDQLAAQLLVLGAGESPHRLAGLTSYSLPALRAYLDGQAAYRRGAFGTAREHFAQAMVIDTSFALAGLGWTMAAGWLGDPTGGSGVELAWRHRDRLSSRDLMLVRFFLGRHYPFFTNQKEMMEDAEALVASIPDSPEAWALLADRTYHIGRLLGMRDAFARSLRAYGRAMALDSSYIPNLGHLHEIQYDIGDSAAARRTVALRLRLDPGTSLAAATRWFARRLLGDTVLGSISLNDDSLLAQTRLVVRIALRQGVGLSDAESVLTLRRIQVSNDSERAELRDLAVTYYLIRAQPDRARAEMGEVVTARDRAETILNGLYANGDSILAAKAAQEVPRAFVRPVRTVSWSRIFEQYAAAQYDLVQGRTKAAHDAVRVWQGVWTPKDTSFGILLAAHFAVLLDAQLAARAMRPDALARVNELDSLLRAFGDPVDPFGNIVAARLWHERGDHGRALASIRRRLEGFRAWPIHVAYIRDEARYAALAGDRVGAIRAYRHYLALRSDPEPAVRGQVQEVRAELAALEREPTER